LFSIINSPADLVGPLLNTSGCLSDIPGNVRDRRLAPAKTVIEIQTGQGNIFRNPNSPAGDKLEDGNQLVGFMDNQGTRRTHFEK
jgi:hypothetical protein